MNAKRRKSVAGWTSVGGAVLGSLGFVLGWDGWLVLILFAAGPSGWLGHWMFTGPDWIRRYRFLFVIYGLAILPAVYELWITQKIPESVTENLDVKVGPGEGDLFFEYDFPGELSAVFPERTESSFARGVQVHLCLNRIRQGQRIPVCEQLGEVSEEEARRLFEKALATGARSNEELLFHYATFLFESGASEQDVAAAFAEWKRHHPFSPRRDPRSSSPDR